MNAPSAPELDDAALVNAAQRDPRQFCELYLRYVGPVYGYILSRVGSPAEAQDVTSQVFLSALEKLSTYADHGSFAAWLFGIARHKVIDLYRRDGRELPLESADGRDRSADLSEQVIERDEICRLKGLICTLNDDEQEWIRLRFTAGLSFAEIGVLMGCREEAAKKRLYRLLARLESALEVSNG
jgi:RNA polymerase sigma-70 factor, ECF subfamily